MEKTAGPGFGISSHVIDPIEVYLQIYTLQYKWRAFEKFGKKSIQRYCETIF